MKKKIKKSSFVWKYKFRLVLLTFILFFPVFVPFLYLGFYTDFGVPWWWLFFILSILKFYLIPLVISSIISYFIIKYSTKVKNEALFYISLIILITILYIIMGWWFGLGRWDEL